MTKFQAIIFDMDGLMVDSEPIARQGWENFLASFGQKLNEQTYERMVGLRFDESAKIVQTTYNLPISSQKVAELKEAEMAKLLSIKLPVMPGLHNLIHYINAQRLPWAVATSSRRYHALNVLNQLGLSDNCHAIAAGNEVANGKPAPDIYLLAASRLDIAPEDCLALEDSVPGGKAAIAAGMTLAAVPNGHTTKADFPFAHHVFSSLNDIIDLLKHKT